MAENSCKGKHFQQMLLLFSSSAVGERGPELIHGEFSGTLQLTASTSLLDFRGMFLSAQTCGGSPDK